VVSIDLRFKGTGKLPESSIDEDKRRIEPHKRKEGHICVIIIGLCETSASRSRYYYSRAIHLDTYDLIFDILARNYERIVKEH